MIYHAVVDTNVFVSSFVTHNEQSSTIRIVDEIINGRIVPIYSRYLLNEYRTVLSRSIFNLNDRVISEFLNLIVSRGIHVEPPGCDIMLPDIKDIPIYEVILGTRGLNSFLITGNTRHFPSEVFVVTPTQMVSIIDGAKE